ncbi:MAG: hypothetical protein QGG36_15700 [Pirellulaceae bacterium]|jgi:hypothetical protein|nr:hypothetical protein [Pirellulaceae bacterium]
MPYARFPGDLRRRRSANSTTERQLALWVALPLLACLLLAGCSEAGRQASATLKLQQMGVTVETNRDNGDEVRISVDFRTAEVPVEQAVAKLTSISNVREVILRDCDATDETLRAIGQVTELEVLDLFGCDITDAGLMHLRDLASLRSLNLAGTQATDAGLDHLDSTSLQTLALPPRCTDEGLRTVGSFDKLQSLYAVETAIRGPGLEHLSSLPELQTLALDRSQVADEGIGYLSGLAHLERLSLNGLPLTDGAVGPILTLKELDYLSIIETDITDAGLWQVGQLQKLYILDTSGSQVTSFGVELLRIWRGDLRVTY